MSAEAIAEFIVQLTFGVSLIAAAMFVFTYCLGCLLRGTPIPFREIKEAGNAMITDAIRACFLLAVRSALFAFIAWLAASLCATAGV